MANKEYWTIYFTPPRMIGTRPIVGVPLRTLPQILLFRHYDVIFSENVIHAKCFWIIKINTLNNDFGLFTVYLSPKTQKFRRLVALSNEISRVYEKNYLL